jgi:prolyl-tRNA synthetase
MKYSKLFGKTIKDVPKDATLASHKLLHKAGFIRESAAGRYYLLPLGMRVHDKISKIVEEEMDRIGAQKMLAPILHPIELWEETNRDKSGGYELMTVEDRRGARFAVGGTAEEMFVDIVRKFQISYKDLPINIYQFGHKFRDELRARGGLLRVREFVMKDAYTFARSNEEFIEQYELFKKAYLKSFERIDLQVHVVPADNGYFGGEFCDEFIVESDAGESTYFVSEDGKYIAHEDIAKFKHEDVNLDEEIKTMETINQPEWVKTMDDNVKHYKLPLNRFLKNVVYKNRVSGEIIIATIRGDLEVNKNKLEHITETIGLLDDATDEDLASLGTKSGWVHSWGYKDKRVIFVGDYSLKTVKNLVGGHKEEKTDTINVNYGRDFEHPITADIAKAREGFLAPDGKSKLIEKKGIEVGNIFQYGQHYSLKMAGAEFTDEKGNKIPYFMGAYGFGIGRSLATVVEVSHDERGIIWPKNVAPFDVHLVSLKENEKAEEVYKKLQEAGIEVLYDDREDATAGEKFADADLIGIPVRLVVSAKSGDKIEWKERPKAETSMLSLDEVVKRLGR